MAAIAQITRAKSLTIGLLTFALVGFVLFVGHWQSERFTRWRPVDSFETGKFPRNDFTAGNSTLGFEAILALSQGTKWRVDGLHAAARASGIDLLIPPQPVWSDDFIKAFVEFGPIEAHGAAMAWLGHIDLLKFVIQNGWGSALIMEDDMDWDVDVRKQTLLIADAVRELTKSEKTKKAPYGLNWDILWMGHCSDPPNFEEPMVKFHDPTTIPLQQYKGLNRWIITGLQENERSVHHSWNPVCTFAYAVSAEGARKLLAQASLGRGGAFDLMLMHACQDKVLDCISINPEIFNPYHPKEGDASEVRAGDAGQAFDLTVGKEMGHTNNILHSARCSGLFGSSCLDPAVEAEV